MSAVNMNPLGTVSAAELQGMDLETMMMTVQSNRAQLLETQLKEQINAVQDKNNKIARLNSAMGIMNGIQAKFPSNAQSGDKVDNYVKNNDYELEKELNSFLQASGSHPFPSNNGGRNMNGVQYLGGLHGNTTKGELDTAIQRVKSEIDSLSNSQQMDMLRLQSLSNKRNEAFETMTNFIKKMQDSRNSIIGNMR